MLRIVQNTSSAGASSYFSFADYYMEGQEQAGIWRGEGARLLGLSGTIDKQAWDALCHNRDPNTGKTLTARQKSERRVGWDFSFNVPKSVSVLYEMSGDLRILDAFRECVHTTTQEMESEAMARVRRGGKNEDRTTGNLVWGEFVHFTSRPVNGIPDPQLHAHCFVFNSTFDEKEQRWKAAQIGNIKRDAPFHQAMFHSRLARKIEELGLPTERTRDGWEIAGFEKATLNKFSRRTAQIQKLAAAIRDARVQKRLKAHGYSAEPTEQGWKISGDTAMSEQKQAEVHALIATLLKQETLGEAARADLGSTSREKKQKNLTMDQLRAKWRSWLTDEEQSTLAKVVHDQRQGPIAERAKVAHEAAVLAIDHSFERRSVVPERQVLAEALKRSVGCVSPERVLDAVARQNLITGDRDGRRVATTRSVLAEEQSMIAFARQGRGNCRPYVNGEYMFNRDWLDAGQKKAVMHILRSNDRVTLLRGIAGTGKTTLMQEAIDGIEANGTRVLTFAPSAAAARGVLREAGFKEAETVAALVTDPKLQEKARGQTWWIDEAGLLGARTIAQVFTLAERLDARLILSGDRRQHGSVERGAALKLLETEAGLVSAELKEIRRQSGDYKLAVKALSEGRIEEGFIRLDKLGWIKQVSDAERYKLLARDYVQSIAVGKSALVVCPTHREGEVTTAEIRRELRNAGMLEREERQFTILQNANLTEAERRDSVHYSDGDVLVFHQNAEDFRKGTRLVAGKTSLPLDKADKFTVFHENTLVLSPGDRIRITKNSQTRQGNRLNNGAIFTVKEFDKSGNIRLTNGWTLNKEFSYFTYGYATTSHASQGRTVDRVLIGQSPDLFPGAGSAEQLYVSVSRAREMATIFTGDRQALLEAVRHSDDRLTATELVTSHEHRERAIAIQRMNHEGRSSEDRRRPEREREAIVHER